ncbi:YHS domain protein [Nitrosococcus halophilus Nc 4]|uniref:YHS domain protein n=1 Tax=Nitrosococcus halophilus (strain Nc4) TaxID=472759 RepID=D5C2G8_NITHN|nr:YHS domain-containing protein [Nitrosococcus halophilus]ADE14827.1 YHS domain protein [Nitrosococcus halophilus Nc 4]
MVRDPVCLMALDPRNAHSATEYRGRTYYFCSSNCRDKFLADPALFVNKAPGMRMTVGVMGSATSEVPLPLEEKAYALGQAVAAQGFILMTGACPGLPYACARGVHDYGGLSVGISPALSLDEHVHKYYSPSDAFDVLIYTGSGLMGREVTNIRSSDVVIILGGRSGTLGEFAIAYDEGKLIGVLEGSGGITEQLPYIVASMGDKDTGARLIYDSNPKTLVQQLSEVYTTHHFKRPSCFCGEFVPAGG